MNIQNTKNLSIIIFLAIVSFIVLAAAITIGSVEISFLKIIKTFLFNSKDLLTHEEMVILYNIRLPRVWLAYLIGGALAISGMVFQAIFKNPLVEPYTLGVSGGAGLAVSLAVILGVSQSLIGIPLAGFIGALISIFIVSVIGKKVSGINSTGLLLTGIIFSFIASSFIMLIMSIAKINESRGILFWVMGNMECSNIFLIKMLSFFIPFVFVIILFHVWKLNAIALGDEEAVHLGIDIQKERMFLFIVSSFLTGVSVSITGVIAFVGLVVPHLTRIFVGSDHRILVPAGFLLGGIFLVISDTIARTAFAPIELPVGVITGLIGGIIFLYSLIMNNRSK